MATLIGIATHRQSRGPITVHNTIKVSREAGLESDFRGAEEQATQVTILSLNSWQQSCHEADTDLDWTERRANLLVDHLHFDSTVLGQQVKIGEIVLEITDETDPCSRMDELKVGLKKALTPDWRGGVRCRVIQEGTIKIGDKVQVL